MIKMRELNEKRILEGWNLYIDFENGYFRKVYNQCIDGEKLFELLEGIEGYGATKFDNTKLQEFIKICPKAAEYNRALLF